MLPKDMKKGFHCSIDKIQINAKDQSFGIWSTNEVTKWTKI